MKDLRQESLDLRVRTPLQTEVSDAPHLVFLVEGQLDRYLVIALAQCRRNSRKAIQLSSDAGQLGLQYVAVILGGRGRG